MQADTQHEVVRRLQESGYTIRGVQSTAQQQQRPVQEQPRVIAHPPQDYVKGRASDKDLFLFFSQLASLLKAGINPMDALGSLSQRTSKRVLKQAATEMSQAALNGYPISVVMERYQAFPGYAVGGVRAGELSGTLPDAALELAEQFGNSARYKRWFWLPRLGTWQAVFILTFGLPFAPSFWAGLQSGSLSFEGTISAMSKTYLHQLFTLSIPLTIGLFLAYYLLKWLLGGPSGTRLRHQWVLNTPYGIGRRASMESLRIFLSQLWRLNRAALPPSTAWNAAAGSVPNIVYRDRLLVAGAEIERGVGVPEAAQSSGLFTHDQISLLATGRQSGDMVAMLEHLKQMYDYEFEASEVQAKRGTFSLGCLMLIIGTGIIMILLAKGLYGDLIPNVDKFMEGK